MAVASNFYPTAAKLARQFEDSSSHRVLLSAGSTGKHHAQIKHGAPFDVFLAADSERPMALEKEGIGVKNRRAIYALGRLVLWHPKAKSSQQALQSLQSGYRYIAIANPKLAPYGRAAEQTIKSLGVDTEGKLVMGENIAQTYQFVASGAADLGLIAQAQILSSQQPDEPGVWLVPQDLYQPIVQEALQLSDSEPASAFFDFLQSDPAKHIIQQAGYGVTQ